MAPCVPGAGVPASIPGPPVWDDCDVPRGAHRPDYPPSQQCHQGDITGALCHLPVPTDSTTYLRAFLQQEAKEVELRLPTAPRGLHRSSQVSLLSPGAGVSLSEASAMAKAVCPTTQPALPSFLHSLFAWTGVTFDTGHSRSSSSSSNHRFME